MTEPYRVGESARLTVTFTNEVGVPADPTTVTLNVERGDRTTLTVTYAPNSAIQRPAVGDYYSIVPLTVPGAWHYQWVATGPDTVDEGTLYVAASLIGTGPQRARLARMVAAEDFPALADEDLDELLLRAGRPDAAGLRPSDAGWVPTWDLDAAAADGWTIKAGRAASGFNFAEDGQRFDRSQVHAQCMLMARHYRRGAGSVRVRSVGSGDQITTVTGL